MSTTNEESKKKACFDNPIFQEDGTKFQNDDQQSDKYVGNDYGGYPTGQGIQTEVRFKKTDQKYKNLRKFAIIFIAVVLIALIVTLLVVLTGKEDTSSSDEPTVLFRTNRIQGSLRITQGPFSVYTSHLKDSSSEAYHYFSRSFIYKVNAIFHSSSYRNIYNSTIIDSFSSGSVVVHLSITFKSSVDILPNTEETIKSMLISEFDDSVFHIDTTSIVIIPKGPPPVTSTISPGVCQPIILQQCINRTNYNSTAFPNFVGHKNQKELMNDIGKYEEVLENSCYDYSNAFFCSLLSPECRFGRKIPPCKQFCEDVKASCVNVSFPIDCDVLPEGSDPSICASNPYKPAHCFEYKNSSFARCWNMGYKTTAFPNAADMISEQHAANYVNVMTNLNDATNCYKHADLFACSAFVSKCTGVEVVGQHIIPPCRSLCEATRAGCETFMLIFSVEWPETLNCSTLPDVDDPSICIGYKEAHEPREIHECEVGESRCDSDVCIPSSWVCDGYQDCQDNTDEQLCATCPVGKKSCTPVSSQCVDTGAFCDGIPDCYENVDEAHCIRLGDGSNTGILKVKDGISSHWQEICSDNWNATFSLKACEQMGYRSVISLKEVTQGSDLKAVINPNKELKNETNLGYIQTYLDKSVGSCNSGKVVQISCGMPVCGNRPAHYPSQLRIVNGDIVDPGSWPSQISLHGGNNEAYYCGASLIGHNWVLTAAHCVGGNEDGDGIHLKIGATRRFTFSPFRQNRQAKNVYSHPGYNPMTVDNDIALIELNEPVYFNDFIRPICLPGKYEATPEETQCYAVGWGRKHEGALDYEREMKEVPLYIVNWDSCDKAIETSPQQSSYKLTKNMMCAGGNLHHDACQGDSGGPLLCPKNATSDIWYISGVISWGIGCALPRIPGVYTNVSRYIDWIANVTNGEIPYV